MHSYNVKLLKNLQNAMRGFIGKPNTQDIKQTVQNQLDALQNCNPLISGWTVDDVSVNENDHTVIDIKYSIQTPFPFNTIRIPGIIMSSQNYKTHDWVNIGAVSSCCDKCGIIVDIFDEDAITNADVSCAEYIIKDIIE